MAAAMMALPKINNGCTEKRREISKNGGENFQNFEKGPTGTKRTTREDGCGGTQNRNFEKLFHKMGTAEGTERTERTRERTPVSNSTMRRVGRRLQFKVGVQQVAAIHHCEIVC